jgi:hypothetical protein
MKALGLVLVLGCAAFAQDAAQQIKTAQKTIRSRKATDAALIAALETLVELESELTKDQGRLRKQIAPLVLQLLHRRSEKVQWQAARALGGLDPAAFPIARKAIARGLLEEDEPSSIRVWEATCVSLLRLNLNDGVKFLVEEIIDPNTDDASWRRTRAALLALAAAPRPSAERRHESVKDLLARFQSFPFHVEEPYDWVAGFRSVRRSLKRQLAKHGVYWADMRPRVQRVLLRFCADPITGALPRDVDDGTQIEILERLKVWNGRHKNRNQSPWIDPKGKPLPRTTLREIREPGRGLYLQFTAPWTVYWPLLAPPMPKQKDPLAPKRQELREKLLGPVLRARLGDPDWPVRGMAAIGLGRIGGAGKELLAALDREQDERVREAIAYGLLLMRSKELRDGWRARADDAAENPQVRAIALLALG